MGFPHCPICVALAFFTFCVIGTRTYMISLLFRESLDNRDEKEYSYREFKYFLSLE